MPTEMRPFTEQDLDTAARLLAERHRRDRTRTPALPARFEDPAAVRPQIVAALAGPLARGVAATRDDELVGFLIGSVSVPSVAWYAGFVPPRSGQIAYAGYAAAGPEPYELYRQMYAALVPFFVQHGAFSHAIEVNAGDETAVAAWFSLGFGQMSTLAVRDTVTADGAVDAALPDGVEIHRAGTEDIEVVMQFGDGLNRHHSTPPILLPYYPPETLPGFRDFHLEMLRKPDHAYWLAYRNGQAAGMQIFHEQDFAEMARPERSVYLFVGITAPEERGTGLGTTMLRHAMTWASGEGYERCSLHFLTANLSAARFWLRSGFQPVIQELTRRVDERIAWAKVSDARNDER